MIFLSPWKSFAEEQAKICSAKFGLLPSRGPRIWVLLAATVAALWEAMWHGVDCYHAFGVYPAGIACAVVRVVFGYRFVIHEHMSPPDRYRGFLCRWAVSKAAIVTAPSISCASAMQRLYKRSVEVLPNPIVVYRPRMAVLAVGRLDGQKGFDLLLDALRGIPGAFLTVCGSGPEERNLRDRASGLDVAFMPQTDKRIVHRLIIGHHLVVCPSRHESFGLICAEAAKLGRRVIATDVGAHASHRGVSICSPSNLRQMIESWASTYPARPEDDHSWFKIAVHDLAFRAHSGFPSEKLLSDGGV